MVAKIFQIFFVLLIHTKTILQMFQHIDCHDWKSQKFKCEKILSLLDFHCSAGGKYASTKRREILY